MRVFLGGTLLITGAGCRHGHFSNSAALLDPASLVIVLDGLHPDYVTAELMPNLHALGQRKIVGRNHHLVFLTVTRVNAASIATGSYPIPRAMG